MKVVITDTIYTDDHVEQSVLSELNCEVILASCRNARDVVRAARGAQALIVQHAPITRQIIEALPELRLISRCGAGYDNVDLEAARVRGVWVTNVPDYGTEEVAAHAVAMAFSLLRGLSTFDDSVKSGIWHYRVAGSIRRLRGLTFGIVGLGRIGRTVAERVKPWFKQVLAYDPYVTDHLWPEGVGRLILREVFTQSNIVSLHLPLSSETEHLIGSELLRLMPTGSFLINTARGRVLDLEGLIDALDSGPLAGAALDVLPEEPPTDVKLLTRADILLSPHAAFFSEEAEVEQRKKAAENVLAWAKTGQPLYPVIVGASQAGSVLGTRKTGH